jgi:transposase
LWNEYLAKHPDGYSYSRYCFHLKRYLKNQDLAMHLEYEPGDFAMIDFAGKKLDYIEAETGACFECETFVSVLPFSGLIFCDVVHS